MDACSVDAMADKMDAQQAAERDTSTVVYLVARLAVYSVASKGMMTVDTMDTGSAACWAG